MKTTNLRLTIVSAGLIAAFMLAVPAGKLAAVPNPNADVSGFCSANNDFGRSHGECVSIGEANVNALAQRGVTDDVAICKILQQVFGPFPLGNCISHFAGK
jgi:hypothetical protein